MPGDKPAILDFIIALQLYEAAMESNRRLDSSFAEEHFAALIPRAWPPDGAVFIAEDDQPLGWAVVHDETGDVFLTADERRFAFIAELFVMEAARGKGIGRALIAACETWARARGFATIRIAVLAGNTRAAGLYQKAGYGPYALQLRKRL